MSKDKKITISHTIATDSMGDWGDVPDQQVAAAFAEFLTTKWKKDASSIKELEGFEVVVNVDAGLSLSSTASVMVETGDSEEEFELESLLQDEFDANRYWEEFCCDSEFALSLNESLNKESE